MKTVATLPPQDADEVVKLLAQEHIQSEARIADEGNGLETTDVLVGDENYEKPCDVIENWQEGVAAETQRKFTRHCPKCRSQDWEQVEDPHYANANLAVLRCKACGCLVPVQ